MNIAVQDGQDFVIPLEELPASSKPLEMCWIPSGRFTMGCNEDDKFYIPTVNHQIEVIHTEGYWLSRYAITMSQWHSVMKNSQLPDSREINLPIVNLDWYDAMNFCNRVNESFFKTLRWQHIRLPTEAEWEYAYQLGEQPSPDDKSIEDYVWHKGNCDTLQDVGLKKANQIGLYDMQGNISEWCLDNSGYWRPKHLVKDYVGYYDDKRSVRSGAYNSAIDSFFFSTCTGDGYPRNTKLPFLGFRICFGMRHTKLNRLLKWLQIR